MSPLSLAFMAGFPLFSRLATEIRLNVWSMCLHSPSLVPVDLSEYLGGQTLEEFEEERRRPPSILFVCRESYDVAKYGAFLTLCRTHIPKYRPEADSYYEAKRIWVDPTVDTLYLCRVVNPAWENPLKPKELDFGYLHVDKPLFRQKTLTVLVNTFFVPTLQIFKQKDTLVSGNIEMVLVQPHRLRIGQKEARRSGLFGKQGAEPWLLVDAADPYIPTPDGKIVKQETYTKLFNLYWSSYEGRLADNVFVSCRLQRLGRCEIQPTLAGQVFEEALAPPRTGEPQNRLKIEWIACNLDRISDVPEADHQDPDSSTLEMASVLMAEYKRHPDVKRVLLDMPKLKLLFRRDYYFSHGKLLEEKLPVTRR